MKRITAWASRFQDTARPRLKDIDQSSSKIGLCPIAT